ncbi:hypothetical protein BKA70DRAFT_1375783 [Coprinopsis sp. MPI-PUGE-AT-0042]|nr:hypothetical protein BKA70DRAFT_1375783 [Coprinopsis sp. MPI-PUGE-AT-0042]
MATSEPSCFKRKKELEDRWLDNVCLFGTSPFDYQNTFRTRATMEECDFNIHLSNTSYGKVLDYTRFECVVTLFPLFCRSGGTLALGASNFHFIREIPMGQQFEIRSSIGGWDNKWLYLVSKFVSKPPFKASKASNGTSKTLFTESDGSVVHAVAVVHLCFKANRITVPPAVVLASNGFSCSPPPPDLALESKSSTNAPPHWMSVKALASPKHGGSLAKYLAFVRSGWKDVHESGRWWHTALGGEVEKRRAAAMVDLAGLQRGLEAARIM